MEQADFPVDMTGEIAQRLPYSDRLSLTRINRQHLRTLRPTEAAAARVYYLPVLERLGWDTVPQEVFADTWNRRPAVRSVLFWLAVLWSQPKRMVGDLGRPWDPNRTPFDKLPDRNLWIPSRATPSDCPRPTTCRDQLTAETIPFPTNESDIWQWHDLIVSSAIDVSATEPRGRVVVDTVAPPRFLSPSLPIHGLLASGTILSHHVLPRTLKLTDWRLANQFLSIFLHALHRSGIPRDLWLTLCLALLPVKDYETPSLDQEIGRAPGRRYILTLSEDWLALQWSLPDLNAAILTAARVQYYIEWYAHPRLSGNRRLNVADLQVYVETVVVVNL